MPVGGIGLPDVDANRIHDSWSFATLPLRPHFPSDCTTIDIDLKLFASN